MLVGEAGGRILEDKNRKLDMKVYINEKASCGIMSTSERQMSF